MEIVSSCIFSLNFLSFDFICCGECFLNLFTSSSKLKVPEGLGKGLKVSEGSGKGLKVLEGSGKIQGRFREDSGKIQGRFREGLGKV